MSRTHTLRSLLELADRAWGSREGEDPARRAAERRRAVQRLMRRLGEIKRRGGAGFLADLLRRHRFSQREGLVVLLLLRRRLAAQDPYLSGQRILRRLAQNSYQVLRYLALLRPEGRLRSSGVVVPREERWNADDPLDTDFTLSAWAFRAFSENLERSPARKYHRPQPYRTAEEVLLDYLNLVMLLQRRAALLFETEDWEDSVPPGEAPARFLQDQIDAQLRTMRARLERSQGAALLGPVQFVRSYGLTETETHAVFALLFREILYGEAGVPVVEVIRIVSRNKRDYLRNLGLFDPDRALVKYDIVTLEENEDGRIFPAVATLQPWAVSTLIERTKHQAGFTRETWRRFRRYLRNLKDSDTFFRDLDQRQS